MKTLLLFSLLFISFSVSALNLNPLPSTRGSLCKEGSSDFKEFRYAEGVAICNRNVPLELKIQVYSNYGVPESERLLYTIDHLIPLFAGGDNSIENLWPQPKVISTSNVEGALSKMLTSGRLTSKEVIQIIKLIKIH